MVRIALYLQNIIIEWVKHSGAAIVSGSPTVFVWASLSVDYVSIAGFVFLTSSKNNEFRKKRKTKKTNLDTKYKKIENTNAANVTDAQMAVALPFCLLGAIVVCLNG